MALVLGTNCPAAGGAAAASVLAVVPPLPKKRVVCSLAKRVSGSEQRTSARKTWLPARSAFAVTFSWCDAPGSIEMIGAKVA